MIGAGHEGVVWFPQSWVVVDAIAGKRRGTVVIVVLSKYAEYELLQVVQDAWDPPIRDEVWLIEKFELTWGRTPIFEGLVAAAKILPTILVASPRIPPTRPVACCIWPLTSLRTLDTLAVPSLKASGPDANVVASKPAVPIDAALAISLPPPRIAEATAAMSPIRLSAIGDTSLDSGVAATWTGLLLA